MEYGIDDALKQLNGMFAFALWDKQNRKLSLVRDRIGEKPLYYGWQNNIFLFGSELKALKVHKSFLSKINKKAVNLQQKFEVFLHLYLFMKIFSNYALVKYYH